MSLSYDDVCVVCRSACGIEGVRARRAGVIVLRCWTTRGAEESEDP